MAMMDHPNIAKMLDGGATANGRPYFVMELVRGIPVTQYCERMKTRISRTGEELTVSETVKRHRHSLHRLSQGRRKGSQLRMRSEAAVLRPMAWIIPAQANGLGLLSVNSGADQRPASLNDTDRERSQGRQSSLIGAIKWGLPMFMAPIPRGTTLVQFQTILPIC